MGRDAAIDYRSARGAIIHYQRSISPQAHSRSPPRTDGFILIEFVDKLYDHNFLFISSIIILSALFMSDIWIAEDFLWKCFSIKISNHLQTCEFIKTYFERVDILMQKHYQDLSVIESECS